MFSAVIAGYLISALFVFCGFVNTYLYVSSIEQDMGVQNVMVGLCTAAWPLAVAVAVFLLTQMAILLERISIYAAMTPESTPAPKPVATGAAASGAATPGKRSPLPPLPTGSYFRADAAPTPAPAAAPAPQKKETHTAPAEPEPAADMLAPSIDEIADIASAAAEEAAREAAEPGEEIKPVIKRHEGGLNFFRID